MSDLFNKPNGLAGANALVQALMQGQPKPNPLMPFGSAAFAQQPSNWFGRNVLANPDLASVLLAGSFLVPGAKGMRQYPIAPRGEWHGDANFEATGGRMGSMTPDEFLARARPLKIDELSRENIDLLKQHMQEGKTLDPLAIYKNGKEDGRHRAHAAKELGIEQVPVLLWD